MPRVLFLLLALLAATAGFAQQTVTSPGNFRYTFPKGYRPDQDNAPPNRFSYVKAKGEDIVSFSAAIGATGFKNNEELVADMKSPWPGLKKQGLTYAIASKEKIKIGDTELMWVLVTIKSKPGNPTLYQRCAFGLHKGKRFSMLALYMVGSYKAYDTEIRKSLSSLSFLK